MGYRIGIPGGTYLDLPGVPVDGHQTGFEVPGGMRRTANGTLRSHRTGPPRKKWQLQSRPLVDISVWGPLQRLFLDNVGPFELFDPTTPSILPLADRMGIGWVTSAGTAVVANQNMRMAISGSPSSVQTAISSSPAPANLIPVSPSTQYTIAGTVENASSLTGTLSAWGYAATPASGTQRGSNTNLTTNGRYVCTFTTGAGDAYIAIRIARTAGSANLTDFGMIAGADVPERSLRNVFIDPQSWQEQHRQSWPHLTDLSYSLLEV